MKIAFICFYEAYPPLSGAASVTYNIAKYSQGEKFLIQLGMQPRQESTGDGVTTITLTGASDNRFEKIKGLLGRIERIIEALRNISPHVIVLEGASWVLYHWLLLRKIRQVLPSVRVVYHSHNVEYSLRKEKHGTLVTVITRWAEGNILRNADMSFAVSEVDSKQFENLYGVKPRILPNGVDCEMFDHVSDTAILTAKSRYGIGTNAVLFMGSYLYKPNREAIDFLVEAVMPQVVKRCNDAQLVIIGGDVPYNMPWLLKPGCIPHEDVPAFTKACRVGVAPIFSGSGTRLKILEYMGAGLPVVSTTKGAEGLNVADDKNILLADGADEFVAETGKLLTDQELATSIGRNGFRMVGANYSWKVVMEKFQGSLRILRGRVSD